MFGWLRALASRIRWLFSSHDQDKEFTQELDDHLAMSTEENVRRGMPWEEANRAARLRLGGLTQLRETNRELRGLPLAETMFQDLRYALRSLRKNPGFTASVILTLGLGIGATTGIFSVVNGVLLRPLPFPAQNHLVMLWEKDKEGLRSNTSWATVTDWNKENHSFTGIAAVSLWLPTIIGPNDAENLVGFRVSSGFFEVMGVRPERGRGFLPSEDVRGNNYVVVLSHGLWRRRFGGDPGIVGQSIQLGSSTYRVLGILPSSFPSVFSSDPRKPADIYTPLAYDATLPYACRDCRHLRAVARLKDNVSITQASSEMSQISESLFRQYPADYSAPGITLIPLKDYLVGDVRQILLALLGSVGFVLLIACVNVASLLMGRASRRRREVALRAALGASRSRIIGQFLTESVLISLLGGAFGLLVASNGISILQRLQPGNLPRLQNVQIDQWTLAFTIGLSAFTGLVFGLAPALRSSRPDLNEALKEGGKSTAGRARHRLRNLLVVADVAFALVLLAGAGLMMKSFVRLLEVKPGFEPSKTLTMNISLWGPKSKDPEAALFYEQVLERIHVLPGVESAAIVSQLPLGGNSDKYGVHAEGKSLPNPENDPSADRYSISPAYFKTMHIPVLSGREFNSGDRGNSTMVVLVNETAARQLWMGEDPIGKRLRLGDVKGPWRTVVGVVGDVLHKGLDAPHTLQLYVPNQQWVDSTVVLVVRAVRDPATLAPSVRAEIASVEAQVPVSEVATMEEIVSASIGQQRFSVLLFGLFAVIALVLAAVGIYGVISYATAERTNEIGIRMALGARPSEVLKLVVSEGMMPTLLGIILGLAGAFGTTGLLGGLLYGVNPTDPTTLAIACVILIGVALLACYLPARSAVKIDPTISLRHE
jgi:putative ABC transport system permease protein